MAMEISMVTRFQLGARCGRKARGKGPRALQAGFTIVELMIGIAIGLFIVAVLAVVFANLSLARGELHKSSRQIEAGRYALQLLAKEVNHAGYFGPMVSSPPLPASLPDPCSTALADVQAGVGFPVQGYSGAATASAIDPGNLGCLGTAAAGYAPNTAVLVVRRANTAGVACASGSGLYCVQVSGCAGDSVRYVVNAANSGAFTLHSNGAPGCVPITSAPLAPTTPLYTRIFYVSTCSGTDCSVAGSDSIPTLKRIDITPTATPITPLVDGVENVQFDYGVDDTPAGGDGMPDRYANTPITTVAEWNDVVSIRVHLLARNVEPTIDYADGKVYQLGPVSYTPATTGSPPPNRYKRHVYTELVRLNNPAGRRE